MTGPYHALLALRRPRILVKAARCALTDYRRDAVLRRVLKTPCLPNDMQVFTHLLTLEDEMDQLRRDGDVTYSAKRHITLLTALIAEGHRGMQTGDLAHALTTAV